MSQMIRVSGNHRDCGVGLEPPPFDIEAAQDKLARLKDKHIALKWQLSLIRAMQVSDLCFIGTALTYPFWVSMLVSVFDSSIMERAIAISAVTITSFPFSYFAILVGTAEIAKLDQEKYVCEKQSMCLLRNISILQYEIKKATNENL